MDNNSIKPRIREFLSQYFKDYDLKDDEDIFSVGFLNSLFAMQLVMFLEKEFAIQIGNQDLDLTNFRTIDAIEGLVKTKA